MSAVRRVSVVSTGEVQIRPQHAASNGTPLLWWLFTSRKWTRRLPINVYVIEHESGIVLFDTGQDRRSVTDRDYFPAGFARFIFRRLAKFTIGAGQSLSAQLLSRGYRAEDVTTVVISHLHQDHIGGVAELPNARVLVSAEEWKQLENPLAEVNGFLLDHIRIAGVRWEPINLVPNSDATIAPFTAAYDVLGDGSLLLLSTAGHTAGSLSMFVRRSGLPPLLLVGDLTYDANSLGLGQVPGVGSRRKLQQSTRAVLELRLRHPGLVILAAHDPAAASMLAAANGKVAV
jgi:N-acyl homoserine lactone hydrolase